MSYANSVQRLRDLAARTKVNEAGPIDFAQLASAGAPHNQDLGLFDRLMRRFGPGPDPQRRQKLYRNLVAVVATHGDRAYTIIAQCAAEAQSARKPANYFCFSVVRRLRENNILGPAEGFEL